MFRFSKLKPDPNKLKYLLNSTYSNTNLNLGFAKKNLSIKNSNISTKLSFLDTEEEMRKYFNIIDYDKKNADNLFLKELDDQKKNFEENQISFENFDRKKLLEFINKYKSDLNSIEQENKQINYFEVTNEFSLPKEKLNFLKDKPNNYILVTNIDSFSEEDELIHLLERYGKIESHNFIKDLNGNNAGLEVLYEKDQDVNLALKYLNNKLINENHFLKIKTNKNFEEEEIDNKTLIIKNLNQSLSQEAVFNEISNYGHIIKFEMPLVNKIKNTNKINKIIELGDNYLNILLKNVDENNKVTNKYSEISQKEKFNFYFNYLNKIIQEFKFTLNSNAEKISMDSHVNILNNLLVEINFFLKKFFPDIIINSLIKHEFEEVEKLSKNINEKKYDLLNESLKLRKSAFEKIINNLENLVKRYDDKLRNLSKPLTRDEILVDLQDFENGGKDPEKINENLIRKVDGEEQLKVIKKLDDLKLYSSFYPMEQNIAKYNFLKSLSDDEKKLLQEKYDISPSINKPEFLEYFLKFNRAMGIEIFDKYIELSKLYLAMNPAEKLYHARNIIDNKYTKKDLPEFKSEILDFLELKNIQTQFPNKFNREMMSFLNKSSVEFMYNVILNAYKGLPRMSFFEISKLFNRNNLMHSKNRYLNYITPINLRRNIYYSKKIRHMIVIYNNDVKELLKNYSLTTNPELKGKFDKTVLGMKNTLFPNIFKPYVRGGKGKKGGFRDDEIIEEREATLEDFRDIDKEPEIIKIAAREFKDHFKYTGNAMNENQIVNRLEHLKTSINRISEFIMEVTDKKYYKKLKVDKIEILIKNKLIEDAEVLFSDDPQLKSFYMKKIHDQISKFSYVNDRMLKDTKFTFEELCNDLIYREYNYMHRVRVSMNLLSNITENLGIKINKNNFVDAVSINGVLLNLNYEYQKNFGEKEDKKFFIGSPTIAYMRNLHDIFEKENLKLEKIKDYKMEDLNIPTLDEAHSTRVDLIENYSNKITEYEKLKNKRVESEIKNDLENYKLNFILKGQNFYYENIDNDNNKINDNLLNLEKELIKKEFEIIQNMTNHPVNSDEYKEVSSLINNINNLTAEKENKKLDDVDKMLKRKRLNNKGYVFVTFISSDEAKKLYLEGQLGIKIKNKLCEITPKFNQTHNNMDLIKLIDLAKNDQVIIGKEEEIKIAEKKILDFESNLDEKLDKKQKEIKEVIEAYKDLYSDPFKKHNKNNPLSKEEEEKIKYGLKRLEKETGVNNYWILEEDKLDELRKIKDKRMTKTYLDWQLLKKGILPEDVLKRNNSENKNLLEQTVNENFSEKEKFELKISGIGNNTSDNLSNYKSGKLTISEIKDKKIFIENYLGKDYLNSENFAFRKDQRDEAIYQEIKELRERFPKELFDKNDSEELKNVDINNLINDVNMKYIKLLSQDDKPDELTKVELLDRMTNLSPINKKIQLAITERNRLLENEELKQALTIKSFIDRTFLRENEQYGQIVDKNNENIQYNTYQDILYENSFSKNYWEKDTRTFKELIEEPIVRKIMEPTEEPAEGDSSFSAFLARRRILLEKEDKRKAELAAAAGETTQFDPERISLEQIKEIQNEKKDKVLDSIKLKYQMHMSSVLNVEKKNEGNQKNSEYKNLLSVEDNIFDYINNKKNDGKKKLEDFNEKLKIEKRKSEFLEELEKNFSKELETLPNFREYFNSIKNGTNPIQDKINKEKFNVENLKDLISYKTDSSTKDPLRDMISLLAKGKITNEEYEKYFVKEIQKNNSRLENWISPQYIENLNKEIKFKMGITDENEAQKLKVIESKYPLLFDDTIDHLKQFRDLEEKLEFINNTEEYFDNEYFFSANPIKLLEELARISKLRNLNVKVKFDDAGKLLIRREYKNAYKYDLDYIVNFDIEKERNKIIENIKNNNFLKIFEKECRAITKFLNDIIEQSLTIPEKKFFLSYVHKIIEAFDFKIQSYFDTKQISYFDLRNAIENLENLPILKVKTFLNSIINILNIPNEKSQKIFDVTEDLKNFAEFSKGIFIEREIETLAVLILNSNPNGGNIPLIENEFDENLRKNFINDVLLKKFENILQQEFNKKDFYLFRCFIKNDQDYNDKNNIYNIVKSHLWKNYQNIINEKYSLLFKKENEISYDCVSDMCNNIRDIYEVIKHTKDYPNYSNINVEIEAFSNKLQEYYIDVANLSKKIF